MSKIWRCCLIAVLLALSFGCVGAEVLTPTPPPTATPLPLPSSYEFDTREAEKLIVDLVNLERAQQGLDMLEVEPALVDIARARCDDMLERDYFDHYDPVTGEALVVELFTQRGRNFSIVGENLGKIPFAAFFNSHQIIPELVAAWMRSPAHREAILNAEFSKTGVGVAVSPAGIRLVATQIFLGEKE